MLQFDPSEISNWAALPDANHRLPILIRRLILATISTPSSMDIPSAVPYGSQVGTVCLPQKQETLGRRRVFPAGSSAANKIRLPKPLTTTPSELITL